MTITDKFFIWLADPLAEKSNQQNQDSLSAAADKLHTAGKISSQEYLDYQEQIKSTSIDNTLANSFNLGLGRTPTGDFMNVATDQATRFTTDLSSLDFSKFVHDIGTGITGTAADDKPIAPLKNTITTWLIAVVVIMALWAFMPLLRKL